jgi:hypothetical protein
MLKPERRLQVKGARNRLENPERSRVIALHSLYFGARKEWLVSTTLRMLYPRERPGTYCTEGWVDPMAGLDVCKESK